jgi:hypothetical protein
VIIIAIAPRLAVVAALAAVPVLAGCALASHAGADAGQGTGLGQKCGMVSVLFERVMSSEAQEAEDCFYKAYLNCAPATLVFRRSFGDAVALHTFTIQSGDASCVIADARQTFISPSPPRPVTNVTCSSLTSTSDGLLFSVCGSDGDILVPAS